MYVTVTVLPENRQLTVPVGTRLLDALRDAGLAPEAPCGGSGTCGKCRVTVDGREVLACQTPINGSMTVVLPQKTAFRVLTGGDTAAAAVQPLAPGYLLAFDIGTTTLAGCLLSPEGQQLAQTAMPNPQRPWGADVVSRIRLALDGHGPKITAAIRAALGEMTGTLCTAAGIAPESVGVVSIVGNPAMQQLFLGLDVSNLVRIPFDPVLTGAEVSPAAPYLPQCPNALLLTVPDISGYIGADTVACLLASGPDSALPTLLVDIGTNGEMVLCSGARRLACATAAGPALEGANISCGMGASPGAIDRVAWEDGRFRCSVIGDTQAKGICGSGILDAVAAALDGGLINQRGKVLTPDGLLHLTSTVALTQEDIRQVQLAKGAIAAGIELLAREMGLSPADIGAVRLAGAFGSFLNPRSAARIGLLPLDAEKVTAIGNAALAGAVILACSGPALADAEALAQGTEHLELASTPGFQRAFAKHMRF